MLTSKTTLKLCRQGVRYCYPDCPSYPAHLNSIGKATWAIWVATKKYIPDLKLKTLPSKDADHEATSTDLDIVDSIPPPRTEDYGRDCDTVSLRLSTRLPGNTRQIYHCAKKPNIHQVTTMLATSKYVLFSDHNHLLATGSDDPSLAGATTVMKVLSHQYLWLAGGYELEIGHFQKWLAWWLPDG